MKPLECGGGDPENVSAGERRLQDSGRVPRARSPLCPCPLDSVGVRSDGIRGLKPARGQVAWCYQRASSGSPASLRKGARWS